MKRDLQKFQVEESLSCFYLKSCKIKYVLFPFMIKGSKIATILTIIKISQFHRLEK